MKMMLKCMPHAQATVEKKDDGSIVLTSYATKAATIDKDGWLTVCCWCSPTTRRHIAAFVDEYVHGITTKDDQSKAHTGSYQTCKALFAGKRKMNTTTGEVVDL